MVGNQYSYISVMFCESMKCGYMLNPADVGYAICEFPFNYLMQRYSESSWQLRR